MVPQKANNCRIFFIEIAGALSLTNFMCENAHFYIGKDTKFNKSNEKYCFFFGLKQKISKDIN